MENKIFSDTPIYPISAAARLLNISVHTVRMYEKEGLIIPFRKEKGHRLYSEMDIERLRCIRSAINDSKISIEGIKTIFALIPCWEIIPCSEESRINCEVYKSYTYSQPCWTFKHDIIGCRKCKIYRDFANYQNVKESILNLTKGHL